MELPKASYEVDINHLVDLTEDPQRNSEDVKREKAVVSCALRE